MFKKPFVLSVVLLTLAASAADKPAAKPSAPPPAANNEAKAPDIEKMSFSQASIKAVVSYHQPQIQACYEEALAGQGSKVFEGKLLTSFVITGEGLVKNAKVEKKGTTLKDPKLHECVVAVLSAMTFPKPVDGKDHPIEYPFNLKAIQ